MIEHDDSTPSKTTAKLLELIAEGEIGGPANDNNWYKSTYFEGIPVQNEDDSWNFEGVTIEGRNGTKPQEYISSLDGIQLAYYVGLPCTYEHPLSRTVSNSDVDKVVMSISIPVLLNTDNKYGDVNAGITRIAIYVTPNNGAGTKQLVVNPETDGYIHAKYSSEYRKQYVITNIAQYGDAPWLITVERPDADSDSIKIVNAFSWHSYTTVIETKLQYYGRAVVGITLDSSAFGTQMPARAYKVNGRKIKIPSNYDPIARTYSGYWDGTFTIAVSNNPAWIVYDLLTEPEAGLGLIITEDMVDKWALYSCGQYCDELITSTSRVKQEDGTYDDIITSEPRFSFNAPIEVRNQGLQVVSDVCSAMHAYCVWAGGELTFVQDRPIVAPARPVGPSNVEGGIFEYTGVPRRNRHSVVKISWNNPELLGKLDVLELVDQQAVINFGYNELEPVAIGCTSRTEAIRRGKYILDTDTNAREIVSFRGGMEWADALPGELIAVQDPNYAAKVLEGRVKSATATSLVLDKIIEFDSGVTYTMLMQTAKGAAVERILSNSPGTTDELLWATALSADEYSFVGAQLVISASNLSTRPFVIISVIEDDGFFTVNGVEYDAAKYDRIDYGIITDKPTYTSLLPFKLLPPTNIVVTAYSYVLGEQTTRMRGLNISWTPSTDPRVEEYEVKLVSSLGAKYYGTTTNSSIDWRDAGEGLYNIRVRSVGIGLYSEWLLYEDFDLTIDFETLEPKTDFENALSVIDGWGSDGKFSPNEKIAMREGWFYRTAEFLQWRSQAAIYDLDDSDLVSTFEAWGTYLNGGTPWTAPTSYPPSDLSLPLWIQTDQLSVTVDVDRDEFNLYPTNYFGALLDLQNLVANEIDGGITEALGILSDWASDGKFSPTEKIAFRTGWFYRTAEYLQVKAEADIFSIDTTDLVSQFSEWGTYLNAGTSWTPPTAYPPSDASLPLWIQIDQLSVTVDITRNVFVTKATNYFNELLDIKTALSNEVDGRISTAQAAAEAAQADASEAVGFLEGWAVDGQFSTVEKAAMNTGWIARTEEYLDLKAQAISLGVTFTPLTTAFNAWGTYLNGGTAWTAPTSVSDATMPSWIKQANLSTSQPIDRADFIAVAEVYFAALTAMKTAIAEQQDSNISSARAIADDAAADASAALGVLNDWASDGKFTVDEKKVFREGWFARSSEYLDLKAQAVTFGVSSTSLVSTFTAWGTYLNAGTSWTPLTSYPPSDGSLPLWIQTAQLPVTVNVDRATFNSKASDYFGALVNIKTALASKINSDRVSAAATAVWTGVSSRPTTLSALNSTDGTKLSGIETGAQVTSTARVNAALTDNTLAFGTSGKITFGASTNYIQGTSSTIGMHAGSYLSAYLNADGGATFQDTNSAHSFSVDFSGDISLDSGSSTKGIYIKRNGTNAFIFGAAGLYPTNNTYGCGGSGYRWATVYSYAYYDGSGFWHDDHDDLTILAELKPLKISVVDSITKEKIVEDVIDPITGSRFLDFTTLPDFLVNRDEIRKKLKEENGNLITDEDIEEFLLDHNEAGWMLSRNISSFNDLTNGAVRQLDIEMKQLFELALNRITSLENEIRTLKDKK